MKRILSEIIFIDNESGDFYITQSRIFGGKILVIEIFN